MRLAWVILVSGTLQVFLILTIPFLTYFGWRRTTEGFWRYIGAYAPTPKSLAWAALIGLVTPLLMFLMYQDEGLRAVFTGAVTTNAKLEIMGMSRTPVSLVLARGLTALSEEILFRGFLAKRMIAHYGMVWGNVAHAALFGLLHSAIFVLAGQEMSPLALAASALLTGSAGWLFAFANERLGNGSIAPGWLAHTITNLSSYLLHTRYA